MNNRNKEARLRSLLKAISWRIIATISTILIVFIFTRKLFLSLEVGIVEVLLKLLLYYLHERAWMRLPWGKPQHPETFSFLNNNIKREKFSVIENKLRELGYIEKN